MNKRLILTYFFVLSLFANCVKEEIPKNPPSPPKSIEVYYEGDKLYYLQDVQMEARGSNAKQYIWKVTVPAEWLIRATESAIHSKAPSAYGLYTILVYGKNEHGNSEICSKTIEVYDPKASLQIPDKPLKITCSRASSSLPVDSMVTFTTEPIFSASSYVWRASGSETWLMKDTTNQISCRVPKTIGTYRIFVAAKNEKGTSAEQALEVKVVKESTVPSEVEDLVEKENNPTEKKEYTDIQILEERIYESEEEIDGIPHTTKWKCIKKRYSISENPDDFFMYNPLSSVLWPGNLIQGKSISSGLPSNIPINKRKPGTITLAITSSDESGAINRYYRNLEKIQLSSVTQAMNELLAGYKGNGYAKYIFEMDFIENAKELSLKLNVGYKGSVAKTESVFGIKWNEKKNRILVKLHQQYFTMIYDDPGGVRGVFTPDISLEDLQNYAGPGNPICYISSVTYGKIYFLIYESDASKKDLEAALKFSYNNINTCTETKYNEVMQQTRVKIVQVGGNAADGLLSATTPSLDKIQNLLEKGANFSAQNIGAPISYTVKYLKNAELVRMNNTLEYEAENCEPIQITSLGDLFSIKINNYSVSSSLSDTYNECKHYFRTEIGVCNNKTGFSEILEKYPKAEYHHYSGTAKSGSFGIDFSAENIKILRENSLFIRFQFYNTTSRLVSNWLGVEKEYKGDGSYEKTIFFDYDLAKQKWVPRNAENNYNQVQITSPNINTFYITNTINYSISIK